METEDEPVEAGPSLEEGGRLDLMCFGAGAANKATSATAYGWNSYGYNSTATVFGERSQGFEDQVSLFLDSEGGRIRMPRTMLPAIRGGKDGWFKLKDIEIKQNEVTASVAVNVFNNPKLRVDRYTGAISISGKAGDYAGQCRKFDRAKAKRAF